MNNKIFGRHLLDGLLLVAAGILTLALTIPVQAKDRSSATAATENNLLIESLETLRSSNLKYFPSGTGKAAFLTSGDGGDQTVLKRVDFEFDGDKSVARYSDSVEPSGNRTVVNEPNRLIDYYPGGDRIPASVTIEEPPGNTDVTEFGSWTLQSLWRPHGFIVGEQEFFESLKDSPHAQIEQADGKIRILITAPPDPSGEILSQQVLYEFDVTNSGALSKYAMKSSRQVEGVPHKYEEEVSWEWMRHESGAVIPTKRKFTVQRVLGGKPQYALSGEVTFSDWVQQPVPAEAFELDGLGIAFGTPIVDHILGIEWNYGNEAGEKTLNAGKPSRKLPDSFFENEPPAASESKPTQADAAGPSRPPVNPIEEIPSNATKMSLWLMLAGAGALIAAAIIAFYIIWVKKS